MTDFYNKKSNKNIKTILLNIEINIMEKRYVFVVLPKEVIIKQIFV